jgi:hypothetical protein
LGNDLGGSAGKKARGKGGIGMLDLLFIALVIVFFGLAFWYVRFCDRV